MQETWVRSLGWENLLEKGKATHSSILPGEFHGLCSPWGHKESDSTERLSLSLSTFSRLFQLFIFPRILGSVCEVLQKKKTWHLDRDYTNYIHQFVEYCHFNNLNLLTHKRGYLFTQFLSVLFCSFQSLSFTSFVYFQMLYFFLVLL